MISDKTNKAMNVEHFNVGESMRFRVSFSEKDPNWALVLPAGYETREITRVKKGDGTYIIVVTGFCFSQEVFTGAYSGLAEHLN